MYTDMRRSMVVFVPELFTLIHIQVQDNVNVNGAKTKTEFYNISSGHKYLVVTTLRQYYRSIVLTIALDYFPIYCFIKLLSTYLR